MFRWAQSQDDFAVAKQRTREDGWRDEATLEKRAFFRYFEQVNQGKNLRILIRLTYIMIISIV